MVWKLQCRAQYCQGYSKRWMKTAPSLSAKDSASPPRVSNYGERSMVLYTPSKKGSMDRTPKTNPGTSMVSLERGGAGA